jgi:hypothetical protein
VRPGNYTSMAAALVEEVAGGTIGAIKALEHLRSVVSHIGGIVLPLPISVANVQRVFDRESGRCTDSDVERLIRGVGTNCFSIILSRMSVPELCWNNCFAKKIGLLRTSSAFRSVRDTLD